MCRRLRVFGMVLLMCVVATGNADALDSTGLSSMGTRATTSKSGGDLDSLVNTYMQAPNAICCEWKKSKLGRRTYTYCAEYCYKPIGFGSAMKDSGGYYYMYSVNRTFTGGDGRCSYLYSKTCRIKRYTNGKTANADCDVVKTEIQCTCFVRGTRVLMADGTEKPIEQIKVGDKVLGKDGAINTVLALERPQIGKRGTWIINGDVEVTGDHPFLGTDGKWYVADLDLFRAIPRDVEGEVAQMREGVELVTRHGPMKVKTLWHSHARSEDEIVYDITLDGNKTYYVNDGYLVHNCK